MAHNLITPVQSYGGAETAELASKHRSPQLIFPMDPCATSSRGVFRGNWEDEPLPQRCKASATKEGENERVPRGATSPTLQKGRKAINRIQKKKERKY